MASSTENHAVGRRELLALGALGAVAAAASPALAQGGGGRPRPGDAGPGVPQVTTVVSCPAGRFQGLAIDGVGHFRGIRYGEAPVGALRWMPPQAAKPVGGIVDCSEFGPPAMQMASGTTVGPCQRLWHADAPGVLHAQPGQGSE